LRKKQLAKRINPYSDAETPAAFKRIARFFLVNGQNIASKSTLPPRLSKTQIAAKLQQYTDAKNAWIALKTWKKARWSLCAMNTWGNLTTFEWLRGKGGFTLYQKCWLEQNTPQGKQPISPCSRRVVDETANPWDFTP
jgi:hypothetical protein